MWPNKDRRWVGTYWAMGLGVGALIGLAIDIAVVAAFSVALANSSVFGLGRD